MTKPINPFQDDDPDQHDQDRPSKMIFGQIGAGKSHAMRATLRSAVTEGWRVVVFDPHNDLRPFDSWGKEAQ